MKGLVNDLNSGAVELLVILDVNPAYQAPADLDFPAVMQQAGASVYLGMYPDETAALATWYIPAKKHHIVHWIP